MSAKERSVPGKGIRVGKVTYKVAASVVIFNAPAMTKSGRKAVSAWLREQAAFLEKNADKLSDKGFTSRYWYKNGKGQSVVG